MYIDRTNSTNSLMKALLSRGEWPEGEEFLYTGFQTAGRGQTGNTWESVEGKNLLCSILLQPQKPLFELNVAVSVAAHRVVTEKIRVKSEELSIKWPNDIYWQDKKIAGILIENAIIGNEIKYSIAGIGLNINQTEWHSDAPNPVSLKQISGQEYNIDRIMNELAEETRKVLAMPREDIWIYYRSHLYRREGFWPFIEREVSTEPTMNVQRNNVLRTKAFMARIEDILPSGEIVLRDQQNQKRIYHFKQIRYVV